MQLPIDTPLPDDLEEGDQALLLSAKWVDLAFRKINAIYDSKAVAPLKITKADAGFLFTIEE